MSRDDAIEAILRKLDGRADLDAADRAAIAALPFAMRHYEPNSYLVREGMPPAAHCGFILAGLAFRQKLTVDGARQIVSVQMRGDFIDLPHLMLRCADHNVQALTRLEAAEIDREALHDIAFGRPRVARAMWTDALIDASIHREWTTNIGRRDARTRLLHLLCEFAVRTRQLGKGDASAYELPMTQEQLGDATGLTAVHVNRTLRALEADGLVVRHKRYVRLTDWQRVAEAADFNPRYLHLDRSV